DSYTNILTVKLFARAREEDAYVRDAIDHHTGLFYRSLRLNTLFSFCLSSLNATMVTGTGALALILLSHGKVEVATVALALPLAWQIVHTVGWVALEVTAIIENVGVLQEGIGCSGAGKSTLVNLLLRFLDREGGRILIEGQAMAAVTQESLRAQI